MISSRYQRAGIAKRILEQMLYGVLLGSLSAKTKTKVPEAYWQAMEKISHASQEKYEALVKKDTGFIAYWNQVTPIDFIKTLKIGSRPASRKPTEKVEDLRAIPWVFSWVQTRIVLPGWFGLGSGLSEASLPVLKAMYKNWGFFRSLIDNAQLSLRRADLEVASLYQDLAGAEAKPYWKIISEEYDLSVKRIRQITGQRQILDNEKTLKLSIELRNPYVDPLNLIQKEMITRFRQSQSKAEQEELLQVIELSISGISSALRNTG